MIVVGDRSVYPVDIETAVAEHPAVAEVAVVGGSDGDGHPVIQAWVVPRQPVSEADLAGHAELHLADLGLPSTFHLADSLPSASAGQVLKRVLRAGGAVPAAAT